MVFEIRRYILERLCFPNIISINKPGVILHKKISLFGGRDIVTRSLFVFEELYVRLFLDTLKELGEEKTSELWYRIGKEVAFRYMDFYSDFRRSPLNVKKMINYLTRHFSGAGMSVFENCDYNLSKGVFVFSGSNSVICRHFFNASYLAGAVSGVVSFLSNENIEAKMSCENCPQGCKIVAKKSFSEKYVVSREVREENSFRPIVKSTHSVFSKLSTFYDFLKFEIVKMDNDRKFSFKEKTLIPVEVGLSVIFSFNYEKMGLKDLYEKSLVSSFEKNWSEVLLNQGSNDKKILAVRNIASAFGLGEPFFSKRGDVVRINFLNPFFFRRQPSLCQYFFNGFLNYLYGKKFTVDSSGESGIQYSLKES